jgi:hypothetical protein
MATQSAKDTAISYGPLLKVWSMVMQRISELSLQETNQRPALINVDADEDVARQQLSYQRAIDTVKKQAGHKTKYAVVSSSFPDAEYMFLPGFNLQLRIFKDGSIKATGNAEALKLLIPNGA